MVIASQEICARQLFTRKYVCLKTAPLGTKHLLLLVYEIRVVRTAVSCILLVRTWAAWERSADGENCVTAPFERDEMCSTHGETWNCTELKSENVKWKASWESQAQAIKVMSLSVPRHLLEAVTVCRRSEPVHCGVALWSQTPLTPRTFIAYLVTTRPSYSARTHALTRKLTFVVFT
jgi:hypothetical protein